MVREKQLIIKGFLINLFLLLFLPAFSLFAQSALIGAISDENRLLKELKIKVEAYSQEYSLGGALLARYDTQKEELSAVTPQKIKDAALTAAFIKKQFESCGIYPRVKERVGVGGNIVCTVEGECNFFDMVDFMLSMNDASKAVRVNALTVIAGSGNMVDFTADIESMPDSPPDESNIEQDGK